MPIYEYYCKCSKEKEVLLPFKDADQPQVCECGETMRKRISLSRFAFKPTGKDMALNSLNNSVTGGKRKRWAEQQSAAGL